jgi:hypothetical protein
MLGHECDQLMVQWANDGVLLWESKLLQIPPGAQLTAGVGQYPFPDTSTVELLVAYLERGTGTGTFDLVLGPLSTTEYAMIPNKNFQGRPTSYWWDRQILPIMNLWPVPNQSNTYTLFCRVLSQVQDVLLPSGLQLDVPWRYLDAFVAGLSTRLSLHYKPERYQLNFAVEQRAWNLATKRGGENVYMNIAPAIGAYYR